MSVKSKVAIQGYEGSFHQIAAYGYFGKQIQIVSCATFKHVAQSVESGESKYGVMAIENSIAGSILPNFSLLQNSNLQVVGEYYLQVRHNLMVMPEVEIGDIQEVHSHQMALLQCMNFLDNYGWKLVETPDTALSARNIAEKGVKNAAAIASDLSAELYGLKIIAPNIHTIPNNYTRFLVIRKTNHVIDEHVNKASLYFKTDHRQGSLMRVLAQMEDCSINMTKLQSYPIPSEPWHYLFHVDMEFDGIEDYNMVIEKMKRNTEELHVYGVYKSGLMNNVGI